MMRYRIKNVGLLLWTYVGLFVGLSHVGKILDFAATGARIGEARGSWLSQEVHELVPMSFYLLLFGTVVWLTVTFSMRAVHGERRQDPSLEPQSETKE